ncbi:hypothetical protein L9F63_011640, partial [Diploptera punctata]
SADISIYFVEYVILNGFREANISAVKKRFSIEFCIMYNAYNTPRKLLSRNVTKYIIKCIRQYNRLVYFFTVRLIKMSYHMFDPTSDIGISSLRNNTAILSLCLELALASTVSSSGKETVSEETDEEKLKKVIFSETFSEKKENRRDTIFCNEHRNYCFPEDFGKESHLNDSVHSDIEFSSQNVVIKGSGYMKEYWQEIIGVVAFTWHSTPMKDDEKQLHCCQHEN